MKVAIVNLGRSFRAIGAIRFAAGDTIITDGDRIVSVGTASAQAVDAADVVIDAGGMTAIPGLIDSHVHITFGDYTPRQRTVGYLESYLHGGIDHGDLGLRGSCPRPAAATPKASRRWRSRRSAALPTIGPAACASSPAR